ncbi:MAG: uracil-DNA glycosylase family protein [Paramuribaculum sp.]|nr:uracil-DNA glycosylase family protein [Paramuribaculum sp.]
MNTELKIETHPWEPYIPPTPRILIMGTFPPKPARWSMDFYYPNKINDFWRIMGLIFFNDKTYLLNPDGNFNLDAIKKLLNDKGIAMNDTGKKIRRLKDNASDKYLEIIHETNLMSLLKKMPDCHVIASTGEKAASIIASQTDTAMPKMGEMVISDSGLEIWRMPSTSRAYPLALEKKAEYYHRMFQHSGII